MNNMSSNNTDISVVLTSSAEAKMRAYVDGVDAEVSGMARATWDAENKWWIVSDVRIFRQEVTGVATDMDPQQLAQFTVDLAKSGEKASEWCVWWHSHHTMDVFWSGTDTATMDEWSTGRHLVSIVTNRRGEYLARYDLHDPVARFTVDNIPVSVVPDDDDEELMRLYGVLQSAEEAITAYEAQKRVEASEGVAADIAANITIKRIPTYTYPAYGNTAGYSW